MRFAPKVIAILTAAFIGSGFVQPAAAAGAEIPAPKVIIVDFEGIMGRCDAAKGVREQLEKQRTSFQGEISKNEEGLRNAEQELVRQRSVLSQEAFAQKQKEFEQKVVELQRTAQSRRQQLDQSFAEAMSKVQAALIEITEVLTNEHNANIVLRKSQVVMVAKDMDVSEDALARLNKKLPSVKVNLSAAAKAK